MEVLRLFFEGWPYGKMAEACRVSKGSVGSVAKVIGELKRGVYLEFDDLLGQIDTLRSLAVETWKSKCLR